MKNSDKWIKRLDVCRLIVALSGLAVIGGHMAQIQGVNLDYMMSDVVAVYVLLLGMKTLLVGRNRNLGWFYVFFSLVMITSVNMIWLKFGS